LLSKVLQTVATLKPLHTHSFMWMQLEYQPETPTDYLPPCFETTHVIDEGMASLTSLDRIPLPS